MKKILVITGASKGIGLATAQKFSQQGFQVVNLSRSPCPVDGAINFAVDLTNIGWPQVWQEKLVEALEGATQICVVHNAAMMTKESVADIDAEVLAQVLQLNVVAAAQLNTLCLPLMPEGSSIVYISSTLGTKAVANTHAYVVSKHAVIGQMRATCQDLAGSMIHTACVCPGFTETQMLKDHLGKQPELYDQITSTIAHKRLVQPEEIADVIWFCGQNAVINGAVLDANLGQIER